MDNKISYWLELSEYDIETAFSMLETKRYLYVAFMCHQAIEKVLKAYWQSVKKTLPVKTHNLSYLIQETGLSNVLPEEFIDFIDELEPLNIETRYPSYKDALFKKMDYLYSNSLLEKSKELHRWIKQRL